MGTFLAQSPNKLLQKVAFCCIFAEEKPALGNLKVELSLRSFAFSLQKKNQKLHSCPREGIY